MRHPAAYPDMGNPREVRSYMHTAYDRYVHGVDMFPRARVKDPENGPRKSRDIARTLSNAWQVIDEDNAYFHGAVMTLVNQFEGAKKTKTGQVIARVGLNAVKFALVQAAPEQQTKIVHGTQEREAFIAEVEGDLPRLADGRQPGSYVDGELQFKSVPDIAIDRESGRAAVFVADGADMLTVLNRIIAS